MKLYKPSESNMLFDGGSLVLYMAGIVVYVANIVKGFRIVTTGMYGQGIERLSEEKMDEVDQAGYDELGDSVLGREDNLKVLAASNTILALVLVGVLVLQAGQWYAERADAKEKKKWTEEQAKKKAEGSSGSAGSTEVKRQTSGKESKKAK